MTLNHSKTWPVSTVAVVQLRVDPHGRTYSELADMLPPPPIPETPPPLEDTAPTGEEEEQGAANDGEEEGLSDIGELKFVDDDRITSPSSAVNGVTEKVNQNGNVANATSPTSVASAVLTDGTGYRFGRRPSCRPLRALGLALPLDLPLDARKAATLRRHYYPEGGWGFIVAVCGVLVHVLNHGLQLGCSQMVSPGVEKFKVDRVHFAGAYMLVFRIKSILSKVRCKLA
nr:unnamed protein product [Callosobruchus analis]